MSKTYKNKSALTKKLIEVVKDGKKKDEIMELINAKADVNFYDRDEWKYNTAIKIAAGRGDLEIVRSLIEGQADVNLKKSDFVSSALSNAVNSKSVETVKALIEAKAEINKKTGLGTTALMSAIDNPKMVKTLISGRADINIVSDQKYSALMIAARKEQLETFRILIESGADIKGLDKTMEGVEIITKNIEQLKSILSKKSDKDFNLIDSLKKFISNIKSEGIEDYTFSIFNSAHVSQYAVTEKNVELLEFLQREGLFDVGYSNQSEDIMASLSKKGLDFFSKISSILSGKREELKRDQNIKSAVKGEEDYKNLQFFSNLQQQFKSKIERHLPTDVAGIVMDYLIKDYELKKPSSQNISSSSGSKENHDRHLIPQTSPRASKFTKLAAPHSKHDENTK